MTSRLSRIWNEGAQKAAMCPIVHRRIDVNIVTGDTNWGWVGGRVSDNSKTCRLSTVLQFKRQRVGRGGRYELFHPEILLAVPQT